MSFVLRSPTPLPNSTLQEVEQIVIIDRTPPGVTLGPGQGISCIIGETLKGPFEVTEVSSEAELVQNFGGLSEILSQDESMVQDGSGERFEGNVIAALRGLSFRRLAISRVDTDATTTDAGATKAVLSVTVGGTPATTEDDIVVPAGTRFADDVIGAATFVVATSEDITIPKGTALPVVISPKCFVVKGHPSAAIAAIDTVIDSAIPGAPTTTTITGVTNATAIFPAAATAALTSLSAKIESKYAEAIDRTQPGNDPQDDIVVIWSARRGQANTTIRTPLVDNAIESSKFGRGRVALVSGPKVGTATGDALTATAAKTEVRTTTTAAESPGRSDRKFVEFPYVKKFVSQFGRNITVAPDSFMASTLANLAPELNPGMRNPYIQNIIEMEDAFIASPMVRADYVNFKADGVAALRRDRSVGWQFQSGITSVDPAIDPALAPIKRRRMADEIQDTLANIGAKYNKGPATTEAVDALVGEVDSYLSSLLSANNPSQQRIAGYSIDPDGGNIPDLVAVGIYTIITKVRCIASMDTLVFDTTIGETVEP